MQIKKIVSFFLIVLALASGPVFVSISSAATTFNAKVTTDVLNIRSGPGTGYTKIGQSKKGVLVKVYEQKNGWSRISASQKWVLSQYLQKVTVTASVTKNISVVPTAKVAVAVTPSAQCMQAVKNANAYCKSVASGCVSYSKTAHCLAVNKDCEDHQTAALALCPD